MIDPIEIREFRNYLVKSFGLGARTAHTYATAVQKFFDYIKKPPEEVEVKDLIEYFTMLYDLKYAQSTQIVALSALRAYYDYLVQIGRVQVNVPRMYKRRFRAPKKLPDIITIEQVDEMIQKPYESRWDDERAELESAVIAILGATGIRVGELCNLTIEDFDPDKKTLRVFGKGQKERIVPIIDKWFTDEVTPKVEWLLRRHARNLYPRKVHRIVSKYGRAVTGKRVTPHTIRHTFATQLIREGVDIATVKEILGHESITTTQKYVHLAFSDVSEKLRRRGLIEY